MFNFKETDEAVMSGSDVWIVIKCVSFMHKTQAKLVTSDFITPGPDFFQTQAACLCSGTFLFTN